MLQRLRTFAQMTTYLGVAVIVIIWGTVFYLAHEEYQRASEIAVRQGTNLARIFDEYISRVVGGADTTLLSLRELYQRDPQHFDIARLTRAQPSENNRIVDFGIIGADGVLKLGTPSFPAGTSLTDREYFRHQAQAKTDELYVGPPVVGRVTGRPSFHLTRRVVAPDGSFGGVILASIDILRLEQFYNSIDIGHDGSISLAGLDGIIRARGGIDPAAHAFVGKSAAHTRIFSLYRQSPSGHYWNFGIAEPSLDGVKRLLFYRVVEGFPLIVAVGLAESDIFGEATSTARKYYLIALVFSACVIAAIGIAARNQERLSSTMAALERSKRSLEQAIAELDHRVKNNLARIAAVVGYTRQGSRSMDEFVQALDDRIQSMADSHSLLSHNHWHGVDLADLVRRQLAPYTTKTNTVINGPDITLSATATQAVGMVLHELVTNAAKYGALSHPHGRVSVSWDYRLCQDAAGRLAIAWRETGGPPAEAPSKSSYGSNLIRGLIPRELGGAVDLAFPPEGVRCDIEIPVLGANAKLTVPERYPMAILAPAEDTLARI
jgi:two-component sensor histidine kinase